MIAEFLSKPYLKGIPSDHNILKEAKLSKSCATIIVADNKSIKNDNLRSIFTTVAVNSLLPKERIETRRIIGELYFKKNIDYFREAGVTKLASIVDIRTCLLAHACFNPGLVSMLIDLLSFQSKQQIRLEKIDAKWCDENGDENGVKFLDAAKYYRDKGKLLIAAYKKDEKQETKPLERYFWRDISTYIVSPSNGHETIIPKGAELIVATQATQRKDPESELSKKYFQRVKELKPLPFPQKKEKILVIGNSSIYQDIINILHTQCQEIVYISLTGEESEKTSIASYMFGFVVKKLTTPRIDFEFAKKHVDTLKDITRVLIITPITQQLDMNRAIYQDDNTMLIAKSIKYIYKECFNNKDIHIVAELKSHYNLDLFYDIGIAQPVATNLFVDRVLANMVFFDGMVPEFFLKTMSHINTNPDREKNPFNKHVNLVKLSAKKMDQHINNTVKGKKFDDKNTVVGKNYDDLLFYSMENGLQLLAIEKKENKVESKNFLIINPQKIDDSDYNYKLSENDNVYVFMSAPYYRRNSYPHCRLLLTLLKTTRRWVISPLLTAVKSRD